MEGDEWGVILEASRHIYAKRAKSGLAKGRKGEERKSSDSKKTREVGEGLVSYYLSQEAFNLEGGPDKNKPRGKKEKTSRKGKNRKEGEVGLGGLTKKKDF